MYGSLNDYGFLEGDYMSSRINRDIKHSETISSEYYTSKEVLNLLRDDFNNQWLFCAHQKQLVKSNIISLKHIENTINEPLIMTENDGEISILSNVCTHRGMLICEDNCNSTLLKCGYHGRVFSLDGIFKSMPEFDGVKGFPSEKDNLKKFNLGKWNGLIFTSINNIDFDNFVSEIDNRLGWMPIDNFKEDPTRSMEYEIKANWALYVDNYLEGFHIPYVHKELHEVLDYEEYRTELFENGVLQIGISDNKDSCFDLPKESPDYGLNVAAYYYWLYPNTMLNFYPWGLSVNIIVPLDVNKTKIVYRGYVWNEELLGKGAGKDLDKVELEDQGIVEAVQRGVKSKFYDKGRFSPTKEKGVHHFHQMLENSRYLNDNIRE